MMAPLVARGTGGLERRRTLLVVADSTLETDLVRQELRDDWYVVGCDSTDVWVAARSIRFDLVLVVGTELRTRVDGLLDPEVGLVPEALAFTPSPRLARWAVETAWAQRAPDDPM
jgi:hypothetical protein